MIDRTKIGLRQIEKAEYIKYKRRKGLRGTNLPYSKKTGFAIITKPLIYPDYYGVIEAFAETDEGRYVSVRRSRGDWLKVHRRALDKQKINRLVGIATWTGFLYISFYNRHTNNPKRNNQISFEPVGDDIVSICLEIPGAEYSLYDWEGSTRRFRRIRGIYVPT